MTQNKERIAVVCSTYRNPDKPSLTRLYGIMSLIDQVQNQNYDGDVRIVIVDDSPTPHPFITGLNGALGDRLMYFHTPERANLSPDIHKNFATAASFFPTDHDFKSNPFWQNKLQQAKDWQNFLPFDYEFAKHFKIDMPGQMLNARPTIGMKKNFGCAAYADAVGSVPDIYVYVDDDYLRSPDYLQIVSDGIKDHDFARVIKTYCHNVSPDAEHRFWGEIDFQLYKDSNNNWAIPNDVMESQALKYEDGQLISRPVYDLYQRNLMLAWPILGHDGALHNYRGSTWQKAAHEFGGFFPTSFSEDIITHKMMHQLPGFSAAKIEVDQAPFIRCSDGRNASDFYCTSVVDQTTLPAWTKDALAPLYRAVALGTDEAVHAAILHKMGRDYAQTGVLDTNLIKALAQSSGAQKPASPSPQP